MFGEVRREWAYHEAGHAVVNAYVGLPFRSVSLKGVDFGCDYNLKECDQEFLIKLAKGTWAGCLVTAGYNKRHPDPSRLDNPIEGQSDKERLNAIGQLLNPQITTIEALRIETERLIEKAEVWQAVEEVVSLLLGDKPALSEKEITEIVKGLAQSL